MSVCPVKPFVYRIYSFTYIDRTGPTCFTLCFVYDMTVTFQGKSVLVWEQATNCTSSPVYDLKVHKRIKLADEFGNTALDKYGYGS